MRKSSKDKRARKDTARRITESEAALIIKTRPLKTWSATMPAYYYTELCPDPEYRGR